MDQEEQSPDTTNGPVEQPATTNQKQPKSREFQFQELRAAKDAAKRDAEAANAKLKEYEAKVAELEGTPKLPDGVDEALTALGYTDLPATEALWKIVAEEVPTLRKSRDELTARLTEMDIASSPIWDEQVNQPLKAAEDLMRMALSDLRLENGKTVVRNAPFVDKVITSLGSLQDMSFASVKATMATVADAEGAPAPDMATIQAVHRALADANRVVAKGAELRQNWAQAKEDARIHNLTMQQKQQATMQQNMFQNIDLLATSLDLGEEFAGLGTDTIKAAAVKGAATMKAVVQASLEAAKAGKGPPLSEGITVHAKAALFDALLPDIKAAMKAKSAEALQKEASASKATTTPRAPAPPVQVLAGAFDLASL